MASPHLCSDTSADNDQMQHMAFGLYVAGATLVCLLGILLDIFFGFRSRKRWLPCRFFSLNSITLTLLSGALKLSVDLSTKMPSAEDQLSKLTGTTMLCICMGFLLPSLGTNSDHEWWSNMAATSIMVGTTVANICIQIKTNVIFAFHVEHILILCIMVVLLLMMWYSAYEINTLKRNFMMQNRRLFSEGDGSMFERLKSGYLNYYKSNPQLLLCNHPNYAVVGALSLTCVVVLIKVAFYSLVLNDQSHFCDGRSDYRWSISYIVCAQLVTVLVGALGIIFRWFTLATNMSIDTVENHELPDEMMLSGGNSYLSILGSDCLIAYLKLPIYIVVPLMQILFLFQAMVLHVFCKESSDGVNSNDQDIERSTEKSKSNLGNTKFEEWIVEKGVREITRLIDAIKRDPLEEEELIQLLSKKSPSQQQQQQQQQQQKSPSQEPQNSLCVQLREQRKPREEINLVTKKEEEIYHEVSSLSVTVLARIAKVTLPSHLPSPLFQVLSSEVLEIICFIDKNMSFSRINSERKNKFAKALLKGRGFKSMADKIASRESISEFDRAKEVIEELKDQMSDDIVRDEVTVITDFIKRKEHPTIKDLQNYMEQLFADMLNEFLVQFPNAIYREITECHLEEYEEKVRMALKLICRVQPLEKKIQWSFPTGTNITALVTSDQDSPITDTTSNNNSPDTGSASDNHAGSSRPPSRQVINKDSSHEDGTSHNT